MLGSMIKKDFKRNKAVNITQWLFIFLSAFLMATGSIIIMQSIGAIDSLFAVAKPPHFMQMHTGDLSQKEIDILSDSLDYVVGQQTSEMLNIDGASIGLRRERKGRIEQVTLADSMIDNGFVVQNRQFDYLVNLENVPVQPSPGEIAVPIKYMKRNGLQTGDTLILSEGFFHMEFMITDFIRDAQMASSMASSTRFLVNEEDFRKIKSSIGRLEYLIEFRLTDLGKINSFQKLYEQAGLPANGPGVTYPLMRLINALGEGIKAAIVILVSLLLILIAVINLRFTILATMEDEIREIGTMKAIGISHKDIRKLYQTKYVFLSAIGCILGYLTAIVSSTFFTAEIALNYGKQKITVWYILIPMAAVLVVHLIILHFCRKVLKKIAHITVIQALIEGNADSGKQKYKRKAKERVMPLAGNRRLSTNLFLSIRELRIRTKAWFLLLFVFALATSIIIIPVNLLNTLKSGEFASYMGTAISDIRMDLQLVSDLQNKHVEIIGRLEADDEIVNYSSFASCSYEVYREDGWENIRIECGDYSEYDVFYLKGSGPAKTGEIALSALNAKKFGVGIGDYLKLRINNTEVQNQVCGIYQDVTNGGYSAKMIYDYSNEDVLWYTYFLDTAAGISVEDKTAEYKGMFSYAKVAPMEDYLRQTMGMVIDSLTQVVSIAIAVAVFISLLITVLFLKLHTAREYAQLANMKAMGFSVLDIRKQYLMKTGLVAIIGILSGVLLANTLGEVLVSGLLSLIGLGLSRVEFIIPPFETYVLFPMTIIITVLSAAWVCSAAVRKINIVRMIQE